MAWASNWIMALGLYAGRQPRRGYAVWPGYGYDRVRPGYGHYGPGTASTYPGYGRFDLVDDLPKIFIPNELTGNEIVRAIKTTGKQQMLTENNMVRLTINILVPFRQSCCIIFLQPPCDVHLFIECIVGLLNILGSIPYMTLFKVR